MKLVSIQYLRGFAAMMVVLFHALHETAGLGLGSATVHILEAGVDIFFVISGFIMYYTTRRGMGTLEFYRHRIIRIVPLYWLITSFVVVLMLVAPRLLQSSKFDLAHVLASYAFIPWPHPIHPGVMEPALAPGWTLNFEMAFYLLFGLSLLIPRRAVGLTIMMLALVVVAASRALGPPEQSAWSFYASGLVLEFGAGVLLGAAFERLPPLPAWLALAVFALGCAVLAIQFGQGSPGPWRALAWGTPALLIVAGAVLLERGRTVAALPAAVLIGDASYSIYLSHPLILSAFAQVWRRIGLQHLPLALPLFLAASAVAAAAAGCLIFWLVERPLGALARRAWPHRAEAAPAPAA